MGKKKTTVRFMGIEHKPGREPEAVFERVHAFKLDIAGVRKRLDDLTHMGFENHEEHKALNALLEEEPEEKAG